MQELSTRFGIVVRQLRDAKGWSQEDLAGVAELNRSYLGEIERATVMPSLATAAKLARALGIPLSHLIARCEPACVAAQAHALSESTPDLRDPL